MQLGRCPECGTRVELVAGSRMVGDDSSQAIGGHVGALKEDTLKKVQARMQEWLLQPCGHWVSYWEAADISKGINPVRPDELKVLQQAVDLGMISAEKVCSVFGIDYAEECDKLADEDGKSALAGKSVAHVVDITRRRRRKIRRIT